MLLGSGELARGGIAAQRLGLPRDSPSTATPAPGQQVADAAEVIAMTDPEALQGRWLRRHRRSC